MSLNKISDINSKTLYLNPNVNELKCVNLETDAMKTKSIIIKDPADNDGFSIKSDGVNQFDISSVASSKKLVLANDQRIEILGQTDGDVATAGYIGETFRSQYYGINAGDLPVFANAGTLTLPIGVWILRLTADITLGDVTDQITIGISEFAETSFNNISIPENASVCSFVPGAKFTGAPTRLNMSVPYYLRSIIEPKTYYIKFGANLAGGTDATGSFSLRAVRIR